MKKGILLVFLFIIINTSNSKQSFHWQKENRLNRFADNSSDLMNNRVFLFEQSGLSRICDSIIHQLKYSHGIGRIMVNETTEANKSISRKDFIPLINSLKKYDINDSTQAKHTSYNCNGLKVHNWISKNKNIKLKIQKSSFYSSIKHLDWQVYGAHIEDISIYRDAEPKEIYLQIIDNVLEKLVLDKKEYVPVYEVIPDYFFEARAEFDSLRKDCTIEKFLH